MLPGFFFVVQPFANQVQLCLVTGVEINIFVMAEKSVHVISISQHVATPTVQHRKLKKGHKIWCLMPKKQMTWRLGK